MNEFDSVVLRLRSFQLIHAPFSEKELEMELVKYLQKNKLRATRQKINKNARNDLYLEDSKIYLELKLHADTSCTEQLDGYLTHAQDGLILVCYTASKKLRDAFKKVDKKIQIPIALVELRKEQMIV